MKIEPSILKNDEKIALTLRALYSAAGYSMFKMSKFEEYDLYMKNKDFLISEGIITFNDTSGRLLALKPDVTLSIVKHARDEKGLVQKFYYNENVYRISDSSHTYKEIMQSGIECIGDINDTEVAEVLSLAIAGIREISNRYRFSLSHIGFVESYLAENGVTADRDHAICEALFGKNPDALRKLCGETLAQMLIPLTATYENAREAVNVLLPLCKEEKTKLALGELASLWDLIFESRENPLCQVDFSVAIPTGYYSGIVFKGYISGIATPVISGGQYDGLMQKLGRRSHAVGFAVYLDALEQLDESRPASEDEYINIALPKGRLGEKVYEMFERAGFDCPAIKEQNRKLIFVNEEKKLRFSWVKPSDVAIYVERGAADIGVAGYDILLEYAPDVFELCDLEVGNCRMAVATKKDFEDDESKTLRVATKFSNIARRYYAEKCRDIDIIHLNGSIELAPILGLSDVIVDIVETGKTLLENDLEPREDIVALSARLIANKAAFRFKRTKIESISQELAKQVTKHD